MILGRTRSGSESSMTCPFVWSPTQRTSSRNTYSRIYSNMHGTKPLNIFLFLHYCYLQFVDTVAGTQRSNRCSIPAHQPQRQFNRNAMKLRLPKPADLLPLSSILLHAAGPSQIQLRQMCAAVFLVVVPPVSRGFRADAANDGMMRSCCRSTGRERQRW